MKKLSIYITVLLAAALTACNEDFLSLIHI